MSVAKHDVCYSRFAHCLEDREHNQLKGLVRSLSVYVLFASDTNLDCNMVHVPYERYHNTVTSGNPG